MKPTAYVIQVATKRSGIRYYYAYKNKRLQTAWSLAGAKMFMRADEEDIKKVKAIIDKKGLECKIIKIGKIKEEDFNNNLN